ncbi:MAG: hypothetical protein JXA73_16435 [Acidobacteria bacterium]|nr:hypothetical protein [Acidobacteriota bacterium]
MKFGRLILKESSAKKPLSITPAGKYVTAKDVLAEVSLQASSLFALSEEQQIKLTLARYELEPDFKLGIIGVGLLTKTEIMEHIRSQDTFGQVAVQAEMGYCNELISSLNAAKLPGRPVIPKKPVPTYPDWKPIKKCIYLKVKTRALFCENTTDAVTTPFASYRMARVHPVFAARGFAVDVLKDVDDKRAKFIPKAKSSLTVYGSGVGHGAYTLYTGHHGDRILEVGIYDPAEVSGKAFHFLSCQTGGKLGPDTVAKGAKCYAGYTENFHLVWDSSSTPVDEFICFAEADSTFDIMMANGATAQQAYNATIASFNAQLAKPGIPGSAAATWLAYDRDHLKLFGNPATVILPFRFVKICFPLMDLEKQEALVTAGVVTEGYK